MTDISATNLELSGNFRVDGTADISGHTTMTDISATNLELSGNFKMNTSSNANLDISANGGNAQLYLWSSGSNTSYLTYNNELSIKLDGHGSVISCDDNGNVGIGTTSPDEKLEIIGNLKLRTPESTSSQVDAANIYLDCNNGAGTSKNGIIWKTDYNNNGNNYTKDSAGIYFQPEADGFRGGLTFYTNDVRDTSTSASEKMRITGSGNVGIGKIPGNKLDVSGGITCTSLNSGTGTIQTTGKLSIGDWQIKYEGTDNSLRIGSNNSNVASGNQNVMIFDQDGKVNLEHTTNLLSNSSGGSNITEGNSGTISYNSNTKTVICTGHTSSFFINQYFPVIDENTEHTISVTLKNLVAVGTEASGKYFYCGVQSLNASYGNIASDEYNSYNYGVASSYAMTSENVPIGSTKTFTGTFKGFNSTTDGATGNSKTKFDPGAVYFRIVLFLNYDVPNNSNKVEVMDVRYISNNKQNLTAKDITSITTKNYVDQITPIGSVIAWHQQSHRSIPFGWALCDGEFVEGYGYTPDLRGRFILGSGTGSGLTSRTHGDTGGSETHTLTINEMPAHNHDMESAGSHNHKVNADGGHSHDVGEDGEHYHSYQRRDGGTRFICVGGDSDCVNRQFMSVASFPTYHTGSNGKHIHSVTGGSHSHTVDYNGSHTHVINNTGGGNSHPIMPPFYTLVYIIKVF